MKTIINWIIGLLLALRYRIRLHGLDSLADGDGPILFLPNHPALIDPVIVMQGLYQRFRPRPLVDENQVRGPLARSLMRILRAVIIPDLRDGDRRGRERVLAGIDEIAASLQRGENVLLYPAGRLMRSCREEVGANSAVHAICRQVENVRIVLVRTSGLWGSSFSRADGIPSMAANLRRQSLRLAANLLFFMPRRRVTLEFVEPGDFPRQADRLQINHYLETFYNTPLQQRIRVPYFFWQGSRHQVLAEPPPQRQERDTTEIPEATRQLVLAKLRQLSGVEEIGESDRLAADLAMDSLVLVEFAAWLGSEFGIAAEHLEGLQTVADCILAAGGILPDTGAPPLKPVPSAWFRSPGRGRLHFPEGATVAELFLARARRSPDRVVVADQVSGSRTCRQLILAIHVLLPEIGKIEADRVGIMLPASVSAVVAYLAVLFSGKVPVMVNWTAGTGQAGYCLEQCGVSHVISARAFTGRLQGQGFDADELGVSWLHLDELAGRIGRGRKLAAWLRSRFSWRALRRATIADTAAILFTSGSEAHPKSVPLSHANFLANGRDFCRMLALAADDRLLGILPVFHSLGLAGTVILPLCTGLQTVYWPNPTEGARLAAMVDAYGVSTLIATPTFLQTMLRAADARQLRTLRLVFTGAERCPEHVYERFAAMVPDGVLCEGYGVTECSPVISVNTPDDPRPGTIGRLLPSMEMLLLDAETGGEAQEGDVGRLLVRGPNVFAGYLGDVKSPFVEHGGRAWYDTGDLVRLDPDGVLHFAGRLKRFVKLGGEMISLPAIEGVLEAAFADSDDPELAVLATPDEEHPELVLLATRELDRQQVNIRIRAAGLSPLHNIRRVIRVDEIPLLGSGKIDYRQLGRISLEEAPV